MKIKVISVDAAAMLAGISRDGVLIAVEREHVRKIAVASHYAKKSLEFLYFYDVCDYWGPSNESDKVAFTMRLALLDVSICTLKNVQGMNYETDFELEIIGFHMALTSDGGEMRKALIKAQEGDTE